MPFSPQIKYAKGMKPMPESWKLALPLLSVLMVVLTLAGDRLRPLPDPADPDPGLAHPHDDHSPHGDALDQAFSQAPDPGALPADPEKERRMGIFHYNEGNQVLRKGDWQEAVRNYKMALHHDQTLTAVYVNMSSAYLQGQQYEEALKTLEVLKTLTPDHPNLYYNLACYYSLTHQETESLAALKRSLKLGYSARGDVHTDPDLANLRQTEAFKQWVKTL